MAGLDESFFKTPTLIGKIAALLPFPWLRWHRSGGDEDAAAASGSSHGFSALGTLQNAARWFDPSTPSAGFGRAATALAALAVAAVGGGVATTVAGHPSHPAPLRVSTAAANVRSTASTTASTHKGAAQRASSTRSASLSRAGGSGGAHHSSKSGGTGSGSGGGAATSGKRGGSSSGGRRGGGSGASSSGGSSHNSSSGGSASSLGQLGRVGIDQSLDVVEPLGVSASGRLAAAQRHGGRGHGDHADGDGAQGGSPQGSAAEGPGAQGAGADGQRPQPDEGGQEDPRGVARAACGLLEPIGAWRSLVARTVRVGEVPGSNPGAPIETSLFAGILRPPIRPRLDPHGEQV